MRKEMELRNVPRNRVLEYLAEAGGEKVDELVVQGTGWAAHLEEMEPVKIAVLSIRRDLLVIESDEESIAEEVFNFMRRKTMRGGG